MEIEISDFTGSKIALICGDRVLTILRDDKDDIPCPNMWELPGGGREGNESPFECAAREVYEELGIHLDEDCLLWSKIYPSVIFKDKQSVFMVGQLRQEQFDNIIFTNLMEPLPIWQIVIVPFPHYSHFLAEYF